MSPDSRTLHLGGGKRGNEVREGVEEKGDGKEEEKVENGKEENGYIYMYMWTHKYSSLVKMGTLFCCSQA